MDHKRPYIVPGVVVVPLQLQEHKRPYIVPGVGVWTFAASWITNGRISCRVWVCGTFAASGTQTAVYRAGCGCVVPLQLQEHKRPYIVPGVGVWYLCSFMDHKRPYIVPGVVVYTGPAQPDPAPRHTPRASLWTATEITDFAAYGRPEKSLIYKPMDRQRNH